jgi:hypothetical protein
MCFPSDKNQYPRKLKSIQRKADRKREKQIIERELGDE